MRASFLMISGACKTDLQEVKKDFAFGWPRHPVTCAFHFDTENREPDMSCCLDFLLPRHSENTCNA